MSVHIGNRDKILETLRSELVGPSPQGDEIDCKGDVHFSTAEEFYRPYRQAESGQEILQRDPPCKRYGVGVLYPLDLSMEDEGAGVPGSGMSIELDSADFVEPESNTHDVIQGPENVLDKRSSKVGEAEGNDLDISSANRYRPSTMGVSFLAMLGEGARLEIEASGGRYVGKAVSYGVGEREQRKWWLRVPVKLDAAFEGGALRTSTPRRVEPSRLERLATEPMDITIEVYSRPQRDKNHWLVTICMVNRSTQTDSPNEYSLFQCHFRARVMATDGNCNILPYPGTLLEKMDEEEQSLSLLYREHEAFAMGHGCAADWSSPIDSRRVEYVSAECLPKVQLPSVDSEVLRPDGTVLSIPMRALAGLDPCNDGFSGMDELVARYESWIAEQIEAIQSIDDKFRSAAKLNMELCGRCVERMKKGLSYLRSNERARTAFKLANHAILLQQTRVSPEIRGAKFNATSKRVVFSKPYHPADIQMDLLADGKGNWRAFQIAFILASIQSTVDGEDIDRGTVELIWFPTGGGKTEAYLGLAAFSIFMRRLIDPCDSGVQVLMRYTLRLLTAQQFQRASALICAMEFLRKGREIEFGNLPFSIGVWLGGDNTPNTWKSAVKSLQELELFGAKAQNPFVITKCPWCNAEMGPIGAKMPRGCKVLGYKRYGETVALSCSDPECHFSDFLPIYVIDEDVYEKRPDLIIGTVDKFAALAWKSEPRSLFGIAPNGDRHCSPPGLIIQDELHLISGPLGSIVGLYELVIEELCTDRRKGANTPPKLVSSTATIRRYAEQIRNLYGRERVALFPPPGLSAGDSFFSSYARDGDSGDYLPGKIYVGVHAPGLGSMQTVQVRTFSALLQSPMELPDSERDPWWTLLLFFNSLRELGTTLSLFQSDIPDYFRVLQKRMGVGWDKIRTIRKELELTGRLKNDDVPRAIVELEKKYTAESKGAIDTCLSSSIIEVGIDIPRLSVMGVVGQPKTTSQYIQVTGRVGRQWKERPGLVVTLYGASKPRDRSHFEQFRSYHERLYAQVEPTSVTPFSRPSLERALHGVMVSYVRQSGGPESSRSPYPPPADLLDSFAELLEKRVAIVDPDESSTANLVYNRRRKEWENWERMDWRGSSTSENVPLLVRAGSYVPQSWRHRTWETPNSMRNVDAECGIAISKLYEQDGLEEL